ncbi:MAG: low-specificity L-threonine aldolase [Candidatus Tectomicrobia bacterium]|uniref:Low-specificity L-threonine aldolase n=1 Tax=Tectimicrobiota bacterium TaxID=2528274 RepID=A0A933LPK4_UNCTE|nr:low-specificity L-threonine aldolase [Candidatus Tectomicrobia bacterium]
MKKLIDLRSDTVTKPSPQMRRAMAEAEVGDDVFGEDPTVNRLQEKVAGMLGFEAALFVPSGSMANQIAIKSHTQPGDEIIMERYSHAFNFESGALAALSGVQAHLLDGKRGIIEPDQVRKAIRPDNHHFAPSRLIWLENTHNRGGGSIFPLPLIAEIREIAKKNGLAMHLDGARLFNACVAKKVAPKEYTGYFDSTSICLSKGLGAPVGSVMAGSKEFIHKAHRYRKMFGGGMRQAGILAAAGLYALENNIDRLAEDHDKAQRLARGLQDLPYLEVRIEDVDTNMIYLEWVSTKRPLESFLKALKEAGVLINATGPTTMRTVTHLDVYQEDIEDAVEIIKQVCIS